MLEFVFTLTNRTIIFFDVLGFYAPGTSENVLSKSILFNNKVLIKKIYHVMVEGLRNKACTSQITVLLEN